MARKETFPEWDAARGRDFRLALRGYARYEVDKFVKHVVDELDRTRSGQESTLTAEEVLDRRFLITLRGYDRKEVDTRLANLAVEVRRLQGGE